MSADPKRPAHYGGAKDIVDPFDYADMHHLSAKEFSIVKYITRWRDKGGIVDLDKLIHIAERLRAEAAAVSVTAVTPVEHAPARASSGPVVLGPNDRTPPNYGNSDPGLMSTTHTSPVDTVGVRIVPRHVTTNPTKNELCNND